MFDSKQILFAADLEKVNFSLVASDNCFVIFCKHFTSDISSPDVRPSLSWLLSILRSLFALAMIYFIIFQQRAAALCGTPTLYTEYSPYLATFASSE